MIINDEKTCLMKKHENHRNFFPKGNGPHKNPYANPPSEKLKTISTNLSPETNFQNASYETRFSYIENSGGMVEK